MIQISARFNGLQRKINKKLIREEDQQVAEAQLKEALMQMLKNIKKWDI